MNWRGQGLFSFDSNASLLFLLGSVGASESFGLLSVASKQAESSQGDDECIDFE